MATPDTAARPLARRTLAAAAGAAAAAVVAAPAPAAAATVYRPRGYGKTLVSSAADRHLLNRFTYGWTPRLRADVAAAGGSARWFARQLDPVRYAIPDPFYLGSATWWPSVNASKDLLWRRDQAGTEALWQAAANYQRWVLARRVHSTRQVQEVLTEFWEDHLHVPAMGEWWTLWRADYGKGLRARALGSFRELLRFAITHPAMQGYLSNFNSSRRHPNENLGRELLELHTVGRGAFGEEDVKNSSRLLTGWWIDAWKTWTPIYDPSAHHTGPIKVLGFEHANADPDGRAAVDAYLGYLAGHPATARRIARKLATRFVTQAPSAALVEHLAQVYLRHGTRIAPVLQALVASAEFQRSANQRIRTPAGDVVATYRSLGVTLRRPTAGNSAANAILWQCSTVGGLPFGWPRPDGAPDANEAYTAVGRMLGSFEVHYAMAGGWWPRVDAGYSTMRSWLPERMRFDLFVDHLSRRINGRGSTALLLQACCEATGIGPATIIHADHALIRWSLPRLLTMFLDQPFHFTR